nr:putative ribonuclease H-like domain-containing protein [Tanacetum cinerariifolium]
MKGKFQMSSIGKLTFFLGLQVKQKPDGIFISQDKYVAEILRKFRLTDGKSTSTPIDTEKPLLKGDLKGGDGGTNFWKLNIPYGEEINMINGTQDSNCSSVVITSLSFRVGPAMYGPYGKFGLTDGKSTSTPIDTEKPLLKSDLKGGRGGVMVELIFGSYMGQDKQLHNTERFGTVPVASTTHILNIPYGEEINMISGTQDSNCGSVVITSLSFRFGPAMYGPYGQERGTKFELCVGRAALCSSSPNFISVASFNSFNLTWQQVGPAMYGLYGQERGTKFELHVDGKSASTPIDTKKPLLKGDLKGGGWGVGPAMYGPYGQERGTKFVLRVGRGKFTGFYEYSGLYLESLGVYL